jgi:hypothetical protein
MPVGGVAEGGDFGVVVRQRCGVKGLCSCGPGGRMGGAGGNGGLEDDGGGGAHHARDGENSAV